MINTLQIFGFLKVLTEDFYTVTGTWGADGTAYFWDVSNPSNLKKIDSVKVDARTVNDVKFLKTVKYVLLVGRGASNRKNGIIIIDVSNPRNVKIIAVHKEFNWWCS